MNEPLSDSSTTPSAASETTSTALPSAEQTRSDGTPMSLVWLEGASCAGCTMAMLGASGPGLEELLAGIAPGLPSVRLVHPAFALEAGDRYLRSLQRATGREDGPVVLVVEGSMMDEALAGDGCFSRLGVEGARGLTISDWVDRLSREAEAVVAIGSCATWGGVPAAAGSPTGAHGVEDFLGRDFRSRAGLPVINVPGCAPNGDAFIETLVHVLLHLEGLVPLELDEERRPRWLYRTPATPLPPRAAYLPDERYQPDGRVQVECPVPTRGWMRGIGGCAQVGGCCVGCTSRDFTDRFLGLADPTPGRA